MDKAKLKKDFEENGWVQVKEIFTIEEIDRLREQVYKTQASGHKGDLLSTPYLADILYEDRVLDIVRTLIGDKVIYFGDSGFLVDNKSRGFHKDNPDRNDPNAPDWKGEYDVIRVGIYLQDHVKNSGGLLLRDKSHKLFSITDGRPFNVPIEKGDVVAWYLKTTHSGNAKLLKMMPGVIINPKYYSFLPEFMYMAEKVKRVGIFLTYARPGASFDRYIKYLKTRQYAVQSWQNSQYEDNVVKTAEQHHLQVMDISPEVADIKVETLNALHSDIPY